MKPGDLVRIRSDYTYDHNGDLMFYHLFTSGFSYIVGTFPANQMGIFLSESGKEVKVIVNGVIGLIHSQYIEVIS